MINEMQREKGRLFTFKLPTIVFHAMIKNVYVFKYKKQGESKVQFRGIGKRITYRRTKFSAISIL